MIAPRQPKDDPRQPNDLTLGGGTVSADRLTDIYVRLGGIQQSITYLEGHAEDARREIKTVSTDITAAKATLKTLKIIGGIFGAFCVALWTLITALVVMMAKHYLGW